MPSLSTLKRHVWKHTLKVFIIHTYGEFLKSTYYLSSLGFYLNYLPFQETIKFNIITYRSSLLSIWFKFSSIYRWMSNLSKRRMWLHQSRPLLYVQVWFARWATTSCSLSQRKCKQRTTERSFPFQSNKNILISNMKVANKICHTQ